MFTLKRIRKALPAIFPRKKISARKIEVAKVKPPVDPREEIQALETQVRERLIDFLGALENYAENDCEDDVEEARERFNEAAISFGFPEVTELDEREAWALAAAADYEGCYHTEWDTMDTWLSINRLIIAIENIREGNFTFLDNVRDDEEFGEELAELIDAELSIRWQWLRNYIDWEDVADAIRNDEDGKYTAWGYFQYDKLEF